MVAGLYQNRFSPGEPVEHPLSEAEYLKKAYMEIGDSQQYLALGENLRRHHLFSWDGRTAVTFRPPGYPLFIALLGNNIFLIELAQVFLSTLTVLLVFFIGRMWFGAAAGKLAALLMAFDLPSIASCGLLMSETLFVFLLVLGFWMFFRGLNPGKPRYLVILLSGVTFGLAALTRPVALFAWLPFAGALVLKRRFRPALIFIAGFALLIGGWVGRNYYHYRRLAFSSNGGYNLFFCNAAALVADRDGIPLEMAREKLEREYRARLSGDNPLELGSRLERLGMEIILSQPLRYLKVYLTGLARIILGIKSDDIVFRSAGYQRMLGTLKGLTNGDSQRSKRYLLQMMRLATFKGLINGDVFPMGLRILGVGLGIVEVLMTLSAVLFSVIAPIRRKNLAYGLLSLTGWYFLLIAAPLPDGRFKIPALPFFYLILGGEFGARIFRRRECTGGGL